MSDSSRISPTAHYTGYVWYRHGLSHPALVTSTGRAFYYAAKPLNRLSAVLNGGLTLERMLLQRHLVIDHLLEDAIAAGVRQVVEVGCGLSARGWRLLDRHPELTYVEGDLPAMSERKRALLERAGLGRDRHHVVALDVLHDDGPDALGAVADRLLDRTRPTAIVTEGLVDYFRRDQASQMWRRFAGLLEHSGGVYLSDLHLADELPSNWVSRGFSWGLGRATGGAILDAFDAAADAESALAEAGFSKITLHRPSDYYDELPIPRIRRATVTRIVEASAGYTRLKK